MRQFKASISILWDENDIRECLETGEPFPSDDAIEEWMTDELREQVIDESSIEFETFEVIQDEKE